MSSRVFQTRRWAGESIRTCCEQGYIVWAWMQACDSFVSPMTLPSCLTRASAAQDGKQGVVGSWHGSCPPIWLFKLPCSFNIADRS